MMTLTRSLLPALALVFMGCNTNSGTAEPINPGPGNLQEQALTPFASCDDLHDTLVDIATEDLVQSRYGYWGWMESDIAMADDGDSTAGSSGPSDYTTTNVQEDGVDEDDIVKTDGNYIYVAQDNELIIVKSWPVEDSEIVGRVPLESQARSLFLDGDRVIVFQDAWRDYYYDDVDATEGGDVPASGSGNTDPDDFYRNYSGARMTIIDVGDRAAPAITEEIELEGWFQQARMIDGEVYAVISSYLPTHDELWELAWRDDIGLPPQLDWDAPQVDRDVAASQARAILHPIVAQIYANFDLDELLPRQRIDGGTPELIAACNTIYKPADLSRGALLSVVHIDLGDEAPEPVATGILSDGWTVYASEDNLYVAQSNWWSWWGYGDLELNSYIHKFSLEGDNPVYTATGTVPGWILNQFSLSEYDGYLRVATTDNDWWWGTNADGELGANNVFVLEQQGSSLEQVGEVRDIAPGEQIYAVRMMGETAYVVTFRQTDPLFTVDLSDPTSPRVMGELILPGYSAYLHPMDGDHLLAVGMDGDMDGNINGLAVNIFDVSDLSNPTLAHQYVMAGDDWASSEALWDSKAFTFHNGVLSIPAYSWDCNATDCTYFSGLLVLAADAEDGLTELGRIDHSDMVSASECYYDWYCDSGDYWYASMRRSLYIEDNIFSLSNYGLKVNDLNAPDVELTRVLFNPLQP